MTKELQSKSNREDKLQRSTENTESEIPWWKIWKRMRYVVTFMAFLGYCNIYFLRVNLSVAVVAMTENKSIINEDGSVTYIQEFDWSSAKQGILLSAFFWGYMTTQLIGGYIGEKYGGKLFFGFGIFTTGVLTLLTPLAAKSSFNALLAIRVIIGICEGITIPALQTVWARWIPPLERTRLTTIATSGINIGTVVSLTLSGIIGDEWGWQYIFYSFGGFAMLWSICWWIFVSESPTKDRFISKTELDFIVNSMEKHTENGRNVKHPWKNIILSPACWAITVSFFCEMWGFNTLLTQLPTFMSDVLNFNLKSSGGLSALPYLVTSISMIIASFIADYLIEKKYLTVTAVRKVFNCGSFVVQTIFMLCAAFVMSPLYSTLFLTLAVGLGGFSVCGYNVNCLDLGPTHAGVIWGISATFGVIPGIISPTLTGYIVQDGTADQWRIVFYIAGGVYLFGCIFYGLFASGELQPWSYDAKMLKEKESNEVNKSNNSANPNDFEFKISDKC